MERNRLLKIAIDLIWSQERLEEIYERFTKVADSSDTPSKEARMVRHRRDLIKKASPRILATGRVIEQLLEA